MKLRYVIEIDDADMSAAVTMPDGRVHAFAHCALAETREIIPEYEVGTLGPTRYTPTGFESLSLVLTNGNGAELKRAELRDRPPRAPLPDGVINQVFRRPEDKE